MELLLWRWSTLVQVSSALVIAVFFVVLARSVRRAELHAWVIAWLANLAALAITIAFWLLQPKSPVVFSIVSASYVFAKTQFVTLLVAGATGFAFDTPRPVSHGPRSIAIAAFSVLAGLAVGSIDRLGIVQSVTITAILLAGAIMVAQRKTPAWGWLATGFVLRAMLGAVETGAYAIHASLGDTAGSERLAAFLASHSAFDTGAEWVIALGCVFTLHGRIQQELTASNDELRTAKGELQVLLDRDALTGVFNRRALTAILRESQAAGAAILFFDLDDFKQVNDQHGHLAGDECLKRFARALQECFRSGDHVVRYAGDEFVVVAPRIDPADVAARIELVRGHLRFAPAGSPTVGFSVGVANLTPDGDPDAALRAADEAMYRDKAA